MENETVSVTKADQASPEIPEISREELQTRLRASSVTLVDV